MLKTFIKLYVIGMVGRIIPMVVAGFVMLALLGAPFHFLDRSLHIVSDNPSLMAVEPTTVEWRDGDSKTIGLMVVNRSNDAWQRFHIRCSSNIGQVDLTDMSGITPSEGGERFYKLDEDSSTLTKVWNCILIDHMRGKPSDFDYAADRDRPDGGGWGNRIPQGWTDDIVMP